MKQNGALLEPWTGQRLVGVEGAPLNVCGTVQVELRLGEEDPAFHKLWNISDLYSTINLKSC